MDWEDVVIVGGVAIVIGFFVLMGIAMFMDISDKLAHGDHEGSGVLLNKYTENETFYLLFSPDPYTEVYDNGKNSLFRTSESFYNGMVVGQEYEYNVRDGIIYKIDITYDEGF